MAKKITLIPAKKKNHNVNSTAAINSKIKLAAYCRVSTDNEEQLSSFENQKEYYQQYVKKHSEYELAGIYADEGISGTNTKKRKEFKRMITDCREGKIDMIITKSISRFARNTQDCLKYSRELKDLQIPIIFEKEGINTMEASGELLFTILSSLAQEESRNISENCKWAIRHNFQNGKPTINTTMFMGYDKDENGKLVINEEQAKIIRHIYKLYLEGFTCCKIAKILKAEGVQGTKANTWPHSTISGMLANEKYCGDILMQKTYTENFLTKKKVKNHGEVDQYFMENAHEAIIEREEWEAVQLETERRNAYCEEIGIRQYGTSTGAFSCHLICNHCGKPFRRCGWSRNGKRFWMCSTKKNNDASFCKADNVMEEDVQKAFRIGWNSIVENKEDYLKIWKKQILRGNPLEKLRANQMIMMVKEGKITTIVDEHVQLVLERIIIYDKNHYEIRFLDGTILNVAL